MTETPEARLIRVMSDAIMQGIEQQKLFEKPDQLSESVLSHILADVDQIVAEMETDSTARPIDHWIAQLRHAVDGKDYRSD